LSTRSLEDAALRELLACPACGGALSAQWTCAGCGARLTAEDGIPNLRLPGDPQTEVVRRFYDRAPFPGYPPRDSLSAFRARAERSRFVMLLDRAIAGDARIAEIGCGTGQMSLYLARADRVIVAADLSRAALALGAAAAQRYRVDRVQFVESDLHRPGLKPGSFDVVYSSGVLHHTTDPRKAFAAVAQLARPGGVVVVGVYNLFARIPLPGCRTLDPIPLRAVRSGVARAAARAGAARGVAPRSISPSRGTQPQRRRNPAVVRRERRGISADLPEHAARGRWRRSVRARCRRLADRARACATRMDVEIRRRRRPVLHDRKTTMKHQPHRIMRSDNAK
jgi:SAM-dependent methyltransferase